MSETRDKHYEAKRTISLSKHRSAAGFQGTPRRSTISKLQTSLSTAMTSGLHSRSSKVLISPYFIYLKDATISKVITVIIHFRPLQSATISDILLGNQRDGTKKQSGGEGGEGERDYHRHEERKRRDELTSFAERWPVFQGWRPRKRESHRS